MRKGELRPTTNPSVQIEFELIRPNVVVRVKAGIRDLPVRDVDCESNIVRLEDRELVLDMSVDCDADDFRRAGFDLPHTSLNRCFGELHFGSEANNERDFSWLNLLALAGKLADVAERPTDRPRELTIQFAAIQFVKTLQGELRKSGF